MTINGSNTYTARVGASSWDPYGTTAEIWVENHDVQAGDAISMTGGGITRSMIITSLKITGIDVNNATVSGVADADKVFHVWVNGGSDFYITPGANGAWTADFKPFVFVPGTKGGAQQTDEFGNYTQIDWSVPSLPSPSLEIDVTTNSAYTSDWLVGTDVTISFDDPGNGTGWDYSKTVEVPPGWGGLVSVYHQYRPECFPYPGWPGSENHGRYYNPTVHHPTFDGGSCGPGGGYHQRVYPGSRDGERAGVLHDQTRQWNA